MNFPTNQTCCGPNPVVNGWCYTGCGQTMPIVPGSNPALNFWNGQNFIVADGSTINPIQMPYIRQASGSPSFLVGSDSQGNWSYYPGNQTTIASSISGGSTGQIPIQTAPSSTTFTYPASLSVASFTTASGSAPSYGVRAWAYINNAGDNATNASPTAGGNLTYSHVSGSASYSFTFNIPPSSANYAVMALTDNEYNAFVSDGTQLITGFTLTTASQDPNQLSVSVIF